MTAADGLYERVLAAGGGALPPAKPPRPSAAVVLWREARGGLEVFWLRRGRALPFMGGWHAFPGGAIDRSDAALPLAGTPRHPRPEAATPPAPGSPPPADPDLAPGVAAGALRELFEETGLLVLAGGELAGRETLRARLLSGGGGLDAALAEGGRALDASRLDFAGRWLSPPFTPVRFDNRFFLLEWARGDGEPEVAPPESESGEWIAPARALDAIAHGDAMAAPPIVHLLQVLAEAGPVAGIPRLIDPAEADLGPLRRIELRPGILLFPLAAATLPPSSHTNCFLVGTGDALLVDPGSPFPAENERLLAALDAARARLDRRAIAILLSHHHPDHVGGAAELARRTGLPVWAHAATAERVAPLGIAVARRLAGGEEIALGGAPATTVRVHHTPGHARGHLALEIVERGDLLCGDLVAGFGTIVIDPPEGDMDAYLDSLERMRALRPRTLFPSHGPAILDADGKLVEYLRHRLAREEQIHGLWRAGVREPAAMLADVYPDVIPAARPLAERQIVAHLERLERQGRLAE